GLSTGCRPVSAITTNANATDPSASAGLPHTPTPAVPATTPRRSVVPATSAPTPSDNTKVASTNTDNTRPRLAPIPEKPAAPPQETRLPVLNEPRKQGCEGDTAENLRRGRCCGRGAHPINPSRTATRRTMTSAIR